MLWLPKWLRAEEAPPEQPSRRTFLLCGAAAGAGLLLPAPPEVGPFLMRHVQYHGVPLLYDSAVLPMRMLYGRVTFPLHVGRNTDPAWVHAVEEELTAMAEDVAHLSPDRLRASDADIGVELIDRRKLLSRLHDFTKSPSRY